MFTVSEKVIIITGSAQGLGRAYALALAKSGARVVLADILPKVFDTTAEIKSNGGSCKALQVDISSEEDTKRMARETIGEYGRIDVLINNAALQPASKNLFTGAFTEIPLQEWDRVMAVNLRGLFLCCRAVFPQMKTQGRGKIVNVSSGTSFTGARNFLHYVTSKGGVVGFTRGLAREIGQYNITVNAIAPGYTTTEVTIPPGSDPDYAKKHSEKRSLKREEVPDDLVGTIFYLCSSASDFVTGETILVNGGEHFR